MNNLAALGRHGSIPVADDNFCSEGQSKNQKYEIGEGSGQFLSGCGGFGGRDSWWFNI